MTQIKKHFRFCTLSNLNKVENWLQKMEQNGLRITKVYFGLIYCFVKCKPTDCKYFFTVTQLNGNSMDSCNYELLRKYNATEIPTILTEKSLFRIKNAQYDISFYDNYRLSFVINELTIRTSVFLCLSLSSWIVIFMLRSNPIVWLLTILLIFTQVLLLHYSICLFSCIKQVKK